MKRTSVIAVLALTLSAVAGCGGSALPAPAEEVAGARLLAATSAPPGGAATVPGVAAPSSPCPLQAEDVSAVVERPVQQRGPACVFTAGASTITVQVTERPADASAAYGAERAQALGRAGAVQDLPRGDRAFFAPARDVAVVTGQSGTTVCTVVMTRLPYDADGYRTVGVQLLEATIG